ncbi:MAG: outer membrane protein assembly factor BamB family protein, partial [Candidatus Zipacnadales bacterium]
HYHVAGTHDNTLDSSRPRIAKLFGAPYDSFDYGGVHFIGLDTASPQDPRPCIGREELLWLEKDLACIAPATPLILFYHHPPTNEYASPYDRYRLYDLLRGRNAVVQLVGHGHSFRHIQEEGFDFTMGGATFGDNAGFAIVDLRDGMLRVAYRRAGQSVATEPVLEKSLAEVIRYPKIALTSPAPSSVHTGSVYFEGIAEGDFTAAEVRFDEEISFPLVVQEGHFSGDVPLTAEQAGAHYYRVILRTMDGTPVWRAGDLFADTHPQVKIRWRTMLGGSSKSTPVIWGDQLLVGANDGCLYSLDLADGHVRWTAETNGDILGAALPFGNRAFVGSADGWLYEVNAEGHLTRAFNAGAPIYSPPLTIAEHLIVATAAGTVHGIERDTFIELWRSEAPEYTIEDTLFLAGDLLCFGAWDTYVYALDSNSGELRWRSPASGTLEGGAKQYYSPADCGPVVCGDRLYIADRKYHLSVMDVKTGQLLTSREGVAGTGLSEDGNAVYLRTIRSGLVKLDANGTELWTANVPLGSIAAAPVERDGVVYSVSNLGTVSAVAADSGLLLWELDVLPGFYCMSEPAVHKGTVYISGMDGSVTAIAPR